MTRDRARDPMARAMDDRDPVPLTTSLDDVVRSLRGGGRGGRREVGGLFGRWEEVVGAQIAGHVRPVRLDQGTLLVEVDEPAWATQVTFLTATLCERLRDEVGVVVDRVEVRVAGRGKPRGRDTPLVD